jgi:hypothetical protein
MSSIKRYFVNYDRKLGKEMKVCTNWQKAGFSTYVGYLRQDGRIYHIYSNGRAVIKVAFSR